MFRFNNFSNNQVDLMAKVYCIRVKHLQVNLYDKVCRQTILQQVLIQIQTKKYGPRKEILN